jgi:hypothetical protein
MLVPMIEISTFFIPKSHVLHDTSGGNWMMAVAKMFQNLYNVVFAVGSGEGACAIFSEYVDMYIVNFIT